MALITFFKQKDIKPFFRFQEVKKFYTLSSFDHYFDLETYVQYLLKYHENIVSFFAQTLSFHLKGSLHSSIIGFLSVFLVLQTGFGLGQPFSSE